MVVVRFVVPAGKVKVPLVAPKSWPASAVPFSVWKAKLTGSVGVPESVTVKTAFTLPD